MSKLDLSSECPTYSDFYSITAMNVQIFSYKSQSNSIKLHIFIIINKKSTPKNAYSNKNQYLMIKLSVLHYPFVYSQSDDVLLVNNHQIAFPINASAFAQFQMPIFDLHKS